jgi:hypothetical protein
MAVRALPHSPVRAADHAVALPGIVLGMALVPSALDLLGRVQTELITSLEVPALIAAGVATVLLLEMWLRFPRTSWLAAAALSAFGGFVLRMLSAGADVAQLLSLLAIVALGVGGAFSRAEAEVSQAGA